MRTCAAASSQSVITSSGHTHKRHVHRAQPVCVRTHTASVCAYSRVRARVRVCVREGVRESEGVCTRSLSTQCAPALAYRKQTQRSLFLHASHDHSQPSRTQTCSWPGIILSRSAAVLTSGKACFTCSSACDRPLECQRLGRITFAEPRPHWT